ncbi:hypothetical protein Dimus_012214 [Dionaea muscipula]
MAPRSLLLLLLAFLFIVPLVAPIATGADPDTETEITEPEDVPYKSTDGLLMSVYKDGESGLHKVTLTKRTPTLSVPLVVDLSGSLLWVNCEKGYTSSTYYAPRCHSSTCARYRAQSCYSCESSEVRPGCHQDTCALTGYNPISGEQASCELGQDLLVLPSIRSIRRVRIPRFVFGCAPSALLKKGFPPSIEGVAGFGHTSIALPRQLASQFGFHPTFSVCLPSLGSGAAGAIFFGKGAYEYSHHQKVFHQLPKLVYQTPLILGSEGQYFIGVKSIRIKTETITLKSTTTTTTTKALISTAHPYTVLESSIYKQVTEHFVSQVEVTEGVSLVQPVAPFGTCFSARSGSGGAGFPSIDLLLQKEDAVWSIHGSNCLVSVQPDVQCLAFVDGGTSPVASIVLGAYQLENILLQFDLQSSLLSYSSPLAVHGTSCSTLHAALASP